MRLGADGQPLEEERATVDGIFGPAYRPMTVGVVTLVLLVAFEAMAVTTAMPVAVADLDGLAFYAWGFSGFMTATMFATVTAGEACDRYGPTPAFAGGVGLFTVGLVVAGVAPTMLPFVVGRMIQGLGAGAIIVALYVLIARVYPAAMRPRVFTVISSAWVLPSIVGPVVAGVVAERLTWRLVFLGLVPLVVAPLVLVVPRLRGLPKVEPGEPRSGRLRLAGFAALGIGLVQYAGQELRPWSLLPVAVGLALLVPSLPRLLPPGALRFARGLPSVVIMRGVLAGSFFGAQAFIPLMLIQHRGLSTENAGLTLTVGALGWTAGSWWQGRPALRTPRSRLVTAGAVFVTAGIGIVLVATFPAVPSWVAAVGCTVSGLGMGLGMASLSVLLLELSPVEEQGANGAATQLADAVGQVAFIGLGGVIFAALHERLDAVAVFVPIYTVMIAVGLVGIGLARRVRRSG